MNILTMAVLLTGYAVHENTRNLRVPHLRSSQAMKSLGNYIEKCQISDEVGIKNI